MADGSGKLPIITCARDAWLFLRDHWRMFLPAAVAVALVSQIGFALAVMSGGGGGEQPALSGNLGSLALLSLPALLASVLFAAAVLRKFLRNEFTGPIGLSFGADELRLAIFACIAFSLPTLLYLSMLSLLGLTPDELVALLNDPEALNAALMESPGPRVTAAMSLLAILAFPTAIYLVTRLFMVNAATIGERRVMIFQTWSWSRGNVLRMLAAIMLTWLPAYLVDNFVIEIGATIVRPMTVEGNAGAVLIAFNAVATFVATMVGIPSIVLGAILYKGLRPVDFVAK